jgi:hypothetical protein
MQLLVGGDNMLTVGDRSEKCTNINNNNNNNNNHRKGMQ